MFLLAWNGTDSTIDTTNTCGPYFAQVVWSSSIAQTDFPLHGNTTASKLMVNVTANANTVNGATIRRQKADTFVNGIVTLDQATGIFEDIDNFDTYTNQEILKWEYTQGDNTINCKACGDTGSIN